MKLCGPGRARRAAVSLSCRIMRFAITASDRYLGVFVQRAAGWIEPHALALGSVVHAYALATVVACRDGYIAILEWQLVAPEMITGTSPR